MTRARRMSGRGGGPLPLPAVLGANGAPQDGSIPRRRPVRMGERGQLLIPFLFVIPSFILIRVLSIIGRFLEHSRVYYFGRGGEPEIYVGSADLMPRKLDRRVEVLFPVEDAEIKQEIITILRVQLRDTRKGHLLTPQGRYVPARTRVDEAHPLFDSQEWFLQHRSEAYWEDEVEE